MVAGRAGGFNQLVFEVVGQSPVAPGAIDRGDATRRVEAVRLDRYAGRGDLGELEAGVIGQVVGSASALFVVAVAVGVVGPSVVFEERAGGGVASFGDESHRVVIVELDSQASSRSIRDGSPVASQAGEPAARLDDPH
ncbi:MAG: hypothetical protein AAF657_05330 [Acidobacteriota bacterium]